MSSPNVIRWFLREWRMLFGITIAGGALALLFSFAQPLKYSSTERILITQTNVAGVDPYTAIKSTERIAGNLSEIIYTTSFFNAVMSKADVNAGYFPTDVIKRRKLWEKTVETHIRPGTGIMSVVAFHTDRDEATELAVRIAEELAALAPNYFGYSVRVQIIDDPLPSRFFAKPDFFKNATFGLVVGFLLASAWILGKGRSV